MKARLRWSSKANSDIVRLYGFLAPLNRRAAKTAMVALNAAAHRLQDFPRTGERIDAFNPRDVRRLVVGDYELQYEVIEAEILVVRIFHTREDR